MMGRRRKIELNSVVRRADGSHWTVVVYKTTTTSNRYGCIQTDPRGRYPMGALHWLDSSEITDTGLTSKKPGRIYRKIRELSVWQHGICPLVCACGPHYKGFEVEPEG